MKICVAYPNMNTARIIPNVKQTYNSAVLSFSPTFVFFLPFFFITLAD